MGNARFYLCRDCEGGEGRLINGEVGSSPTREHRDGNGGKGVRGEREAKCEPWDRRVWIDRTVEMDLDVDFVAKFGGRFRAGPLFT